jgi:hypothetical protein
MSEYTPSWASEPTVDDAVPEDEQYGGGMEFDHEAAHETPGSGRDRGGDELHGETDRDRDRDYTPTYEAWDLERDPIPEDEQYGGGLEFDHEAARETTGLLNRSTDSSDGGPDPDPETPAWVDDSRAIRGGDLRDPTDIDAVCANCVTDASRGVYQSVEFAHTSAWYQLLDRHGFGRSVETDADRIWGADGGLVVRAHGQSTDPETNEYLSYLEITGPADAVASFVHDLLDLAPYIKRELRAPSLVEHADAAQDAGEPVPDAHRLVDRERAAKTVSHLAADVEVHR